MRRIAILAAFLGAGALGQKNSNTITLRIGTTTQTYSIVIGMTLSCLNPDGSKPPTGQPIAINKGQQSQCTLTLDQPAPAGGLAVTPYSIDATLTLSPATLTVPENQTSTTCTVTYPNPPQ
jgi:hypothetical protein